MWISLVVSTIQLLVLVTRVAAHRCSRGSSCSRVNLPGCKPQIAGCCTSPFAPMLDKCLAYVCVLFYINDAQFFTRAPRVVVSKRNPVPRVVVSKRNPVPSSYKKETQSRRCVKKKPRPSGRCVKKKPSPSGRCVKKKPSPVVVLKRNPFPPQYRQSCLSKNFNLEVIYVSVLYSSLMGNLDSTVGTVKGRTTDCCCSILARFKEFFSFRQRPGRLGWPTE